MFFASCFYLSDQRTISNLLLERSYSSNWRCVALDTSMKPPADWQGKQGKGKGKSEKRKTPLAALARLKAYAACLLLQEVW